VNSAAANPNRVDLLRRSDGPRYHRVTLIIERNGAITLNTHELGAAFEDAWGLDDEEVTLSVAPENLSRLALALTAEALKGGADAIARLAEICDAYDVPCRIACWS
jgi:hypothetical protein